MSNIYIQEPPTSAKVRHGYMDVIFILRKYYIPSISGAIENLCRGY